MAILGRIQQTASISGNTTVTLLNAPGAQGGAGPSRVIIDSISGFGRANTTVAAAGTCLVQLNDNAGNAVWANAIPMTVTAQAVGFHWTWAEGSGPHIDDSAPYILVSGANGSTLTNGIITVVYHHGMS